MIGTGTLDVTTPTEREIVMARRFDAARDRVFDALTRPELLARWYAAPGWSLAACEIDCRVGGAWRFVSRNREGAEMVQCGRYREIVPPERVVFTESWEGWDQGEILVTTVLADEEGGTGFRTALLFPSHGARDAARNAGMERGAAQVYDKLAEFLASGS